MAALAEQIYEGLVVAGGATLTETQLEALAKQALIAEAAYIKIRNVQRV